MPFKIYKKYVMLLAFTAPALIFYAIFLLIPTISGMYYSFTDWNGLNPNYNFIGLGNFVESLKEDPDFLNSLWFTLKYVLVMIVLQNVLALVLAVLIESRTRSKGFFRTIFFMPNMISTIISAFMWTFVFSSVLPQIAEKTAIAFLGQSWLGDPKVSFFSIIIASLWNGVGYMMIIYLAALQGVPQSLKEAAIIDGANAFQTLRSVTLPMITHAITICFFLTLNGAFKVYEVVYGLTGGGPGRSTQVITMNIYEEAFSNNFRYGYASAKSVILFAIVLIFTLIQLRVMKKREVEA
ncbi:raffinose/stachyose/melibiose transport system permease protein [Paenibacillus jamilae]|uniref:carbohydrate ABC transporter permease n=1 Tax=Paenibacillus polymyxa TaxID=1406 RepID=UPI000F87438E|nr:sugar ABC transporter permease [Paenibacillus polymyxa]MDP9678890.1 raffinose/stachyose/melibiose transport system permease protein [Paenibacillus jamilae]MEE4580919.1 sugar ABC transporter permease [Paenibacillus polymyxa]QDA26305.1 sugar ABC transporter permease [Paenibacillus polymyxa]RTZ31214.1 sugar ABC transporter permease [Paenibacillus polymyxa]UMR36497.1 sugar ABC transporter permease [Paenibacillus polymyxa]